MDICLIFSYLIYFRIDAPIITCGKSHASLGQVNATLICDVTARPETTALYWVIDGNGTKLHPGHVQHNYWTLNMLGISFTIMNIVLS